MYVDTTYRSQNRSANSANSIECKCVRNLSWLENLHQRSATDADRGTPHEATQEAQYQNGLQIVGQSRSNVEQAESNAAKEIYRRTSECG